MSLVLAPMLACCGLAVPMLSGRGLGATGGTLDKLESIPGFRTNLSRNEIGEVVERVGCVITGTTADLAPADRQLYALRDVTGTVPSVGLITASILSKKLAEGLDALVFDVKFGSGAFMKSVKQAEQLATSLVETARRMGVVATALLTDMEQPLGRYAGNALEVNEAVAALEGRGPDDLMDVVFALGAELLVAGSEREAPVAASELIDEETAEELQQAHARLRQTIDSGDARAKFAEMAAAQGGDLNAPRPIALTHEILAPADGYVAAVDAEQLGHAIIAMRGGRMRLDDPIDHSTGLETLVKLGDRVERGQPLMRYFAPHALAEQAATALQGAVSINDFQPARPRLIRHRIR